MFPFIQEFSSLWMWFRHQVCEMSHLLGSRINTFFSFGQGFYYSEISDVKQIYLSAFSKFSKENRHNDQDNSKPKS